MVVYSHSPGVQAVPYTVIANERSEVQLLYPLCSLMVFLSLYLTSFQTSRGKS